MLDARLKHLAIFREHFCSHTFMDLPFDFLVAIPFCSSTSQISVTMLLDLWTLLLSMIDAKDSPFSDLAHIKHQVNAGTHMTHPFLKLPAACHFRFQHLSKVTFVLSLCCTVERIPNFSNLSLLRESSYLS